MQSLEELNNIFLFSYLTEGTVCKLFTFIKSSKYENCILSQSHFEPKSTKFKSHITMQGTHKHTPCSKITIHFNFLNENRYNLY